MSVNMSGRSDSVAPVAKPWMIRVARWASKLFCVAEPIVAANRQMTQTIKVGRLPNARDIGKIKKLPKPTKSDGKVSSQTIWVGE